MNTVTLLIGNGKAKVVLGDISRVDCRGYIAFDLAPPWTAPYGFNAKQRRMHQRAIRKLSK